ncbi:hypothetical protein FSP39_005269 [Pinctada imbricata]|uniref:Zinc finger PHD-type domain-containing protein n=1 Tax=Pinctada imbricata TaxID=66713 RepID=A0AA88Y2H3_PINIB|nr:hypothetical protein FSP39_005269 [Pinctada imbricata]
MDSLAKQRYAVTSKLAARVLGFSKDISGVPAIKYGIENEGKASQYFELMMKTEHRDVLVENCGLFVRPDRPFIACSPDRLVYCKCHGHSTLEVKCPYVLRQKSIVDGWRDTDFLHSVDGKICLKESHKYYTQVMSQMAISGTNHAYFLVWLPVGSFVQKLTFDGSFWISVQQKLVQFFSSFILSYLIGQKDLFICPKCEQVCLQDSEIKSDFENSIHCECCNLWLHWVCAGVNEDPQSDTWVCKSCTDAAGTNY